MIGAGASLLHYRLVEKIGEGGMGAVWKATDSTLDRDVAIKVLPEAFASDPERLARFEREAKVLASLNHPNIAAIYGFHEVGPSTGSGPGVRFLAMEMVPGEELDQRVSRGPMPIDDALQVALKIAEALEYAHERGIVHRDLKPANIKITPDGTVKVLDFGLAKAVVGDSPASDSTSTPTILPTMTSAGTAIGVILGTAAYMSPEQARGKPVDKRADIWAFGVVLYEMLTGTRLFTGGTVSDVLAAVLTREPDWKALPSPTPVAVRRLLARCLDRDARKRLRDIGEAALLLADPGRSDGSPEPPASTRPVTRERAAWATAALAVVLAVVTAIRAPWGRSESGATGPLYFSLSTALSEGAPSEAVIAPDGLRVAFVGRLPSAATDTIFVLSLREGASKSLAGTEGASRPAFSPDGKWLVFFAHNRSLKKVPADGGSVVDLASGNFRYAQAAWADAGRILLTVFNWDQPGLLHEIPESGGPLIAIPGRPEHAAEAAIDPLALPGGRTVLVRTGRDFSVVAVHSLDTGERRVLAQNARFARLVDGNVIWLENDKLMAAPFDPGLLAFSSAPVAIPTDGLFTGGPPTAIDVSANGSLIFLNTAVPSPGTAADLGTGRLVWIDRSGKRTPGPGGDVVAAGEPRLGPDDAHAVIDGSSDQSLSDVWTIDLRRGALSRLSFNDGEDETGVWSPDGAWIAWASSRLGEGRALYRRRSDGSGKEERVWDSAGLHFHAAAWTPDGRGILVTVDNPATGFDVLLVILGPQPTAKPLLTDPFNETSVRISPDGRWIVYASDESGRNEIYARAFPDLGSKVQISVAGGTEPVWHPGGGEIVYRSTASRDFMSVTLQDNGALAVSPPRVLASDAGLSRGELDHTHYAVARDGRLLAVQAASSDARGELMFVLGWAQAAGLLR